MSTLYGYDENISDEIETIDSDEEDQKRSSRDPDKFVVIIQIHFEIYSI